MGYNGGMILAAQTFDMNLFLWVGALSTLVMIGVISGFMVAVMDRVSFANEKSPAGVVLWSAALVATVLELLVMVAALYAVNGMGWPESFSGWILGIGLGLLPSVICGMVVYGIILKRGKLTSLGLSLAGSVCLVVCMPTAVMVAAFMAVGIGRVSQ